MILRDRVYPEFLTHTQANARWSIVKPALQQLPGDLADIYVPDEGKVWLKHDWETVEARIQGAIADDTVMLKWVMKSGCSFTVCAPVPSMIQSLYASSHAFLMLGGTV